MLTDAQIVDKLATALRGQTLELQPARDALARAQVVSAARPLFLEERVILRALAEEIEDLSTEVAVRAALAHSPELPT